MQQGDKVIDIVSGITCTFVRKCNDKWSIIFIPDSETGGGEVRVETGDLISLPDLMMKNPIDFNKLMEGKKYSDIGEMNITLTEATCYGCLEMRVDLIMSDLYCGISGGIIDKKDRRIINTKCPKGLY